jgi:cell division protein FtsZ
MIEEDMAVLDNLKYEMQDDARQPSRIKVIGVGGGGSNAVAHMLGAGLTGVDFYIINTDSQALAACAVPNKLQIGSKITHGRGAGADAETGRQAALDDTERIVEILEGAEVVFVTAGLGSGTGTGAAPVVASLAKEMNALTVAVVTKPFSFEGARRTEQAERGIVELAANVDTVIAIPNERLLELAPRGTSIVEAFRMGHDFIRRTVEDIVEIMTTPGFINRDFSDVRSTMMGMGCALLGTATAKGENAAVEAARQAISNPLLEAPGIRGARNILLNITGSSRLGLHEVNEACLLIREAAGGGDVQLNLGLVVNEALADSVKVTVIATGFEAVRQTAQAPAPSQPVGESGWLSETPAVEPGPAMQAVAEPVAPVPAASAPEPEPEAVPEPEDDPDDLDTPAYLRQRRVLR